MITYILLQIIFETCEREMLVSLPKCSSTLKSQMMTKNGELHYFFLPILF